jgi:gliding motility-associated lipoprotein GldH
MVRISKPRCVKIPGFQMVLLCIIALTGFSCVKNESTELYHRFPGKSWGRFNLLSFEIPVKEINSYNIYLFARLSPDFSYETLDFNMIMDTPAGEERIYEYQMEVKSGKGNFCIECNKDSCQGIILLKKEIRLSKPGVLKIEIENLTPRLTTEGVLGIGIRLVKSGK